MDSFRFALSFALIVCLSFLLTFYIYFRLLYGVKKNREVPRWIYKFGQAFQGRVHVEYENATTSTALRDANIFLFFWLLSNVLSFAFLYYKSGNYYAAVYQCCKLQFLIVLLAMMLHSLFQFFRMTFHSSRESPSLVFHKQCTFLASLLLRLPFGFLCLYHGVSGKPSNRTN